MNDEARHLVDGMLLQLGHLIVSDIEIAHHLHRYSTPVPTAYGGRVFVQRTTDHPRPVGEQSQVLADIIPPVLLNMEHAHLFLKFRMVLSVEIGIGGVPSVVDMPLLQLTGEGKTADMLDDLFGCVNTITV